MNKLSEEVVMQMFDSVIKAKNIEQIKPAITFLIALHLAKDET